MIYVTVSLTDITHATVSLVCEMLLRDLSVESHERQTLMHDIRHVDTETNDMIAECTTHTVIVDH